MTETYQYDNMLSVGENILTPLQPTEAGEKLTDLILEVFRLNGRLLVTGDRLVASLGLTSARWQVLGAIALVTIPQSVSWLARDMGLNRQGVQRIVNEMCKMGLVEFQANPHHKRAQLVVLSEMGRVAFDAATQLQVPWVNRLAEGISPADIEAVNRVAVLLRERLDSDQQMVIG